MTSYIRGPSHMLKWRTQQDGDKEMVKKLNDVEIARPSLMLERVDYALRTLKVERL